MTTNDHALVSAIIPTIGRPSLRAAVESALHQTYPVHEIIVVMDADGEPDLAEDDRVIVVHTETPGRGAAVARDLGIRNSTGSVIALLDDDDEWLPNKIESQLAVAPDSDAWIVSCRLSVEVRGEQTELPRTLIAPRQSVEEYLFTFADGLRFGGASLQTSTLCFPRAIADKVPLSESAGSVHDDPLWLMKVRNALPEVEIIALPDALVRYGMTDDSLSRANTDRSREYTQWGLDHLDEASSRIRGDYLLTSPIAAAVQAGSIPSTVRAVGVGIRHGRPGVRALLYAFLSIVRATVRTVRRATRRHPSAERSPVTDIRTRSVVDKHPASDPLSISIVTICFRDLEGLRATVESVRAQQYSGPTEHIIIDGGSGPEVEEYLSTLEPQPAFWCSEPDGGRYDAMNKGIAKAGGDLVWLMHAGDVFADDTVLSDVASFIAHHPSPRSVWGYGQVRVIGRPGLVEPIWGAIPFDLHQFMIGSQPIPHQGAFFGADLLAELPPYDLDFGLAADQLYMFRAALHREPVGLRRVVCDFDSGGAGSVRPIQDSFADLRRGWDIVGVYPFDSRLKARVHSVYRETLARFLFGAIMIRRRFDIG